MGVFSGHETPIVAGATTEAVSCQVFLLSVRLSVCPWWSECEHRFTVYERQGDFVWEGEEKSSATASLNTTLKAYVELKKVLKFHL